jgi:hypothetical protein
MILPGQIERARFREFVVLLVIAGGLITILLAIIAGLFLAKGSSSLPNWAENVLVSIATASTLKLGDCLAALVQLASGRQVEGLGNQLAKSSAPDGGPAGTPDDPLSVAGADAGAPPVKTRDVKP